MYVFLYYIFCLWILNKKTCNYSISQKKVEEEDNLQNLLITTQITELLNN